MTTANYAPKKIGDASLVYLIDKLCLNFYEPIPVQVTALIVKSNNFIYTGQLFKIGASTVVKIGIVTKDANDVYSAKVIIGNVTDGLHIFRPEPLKFLYGSKNDFVKEILSSEKYVGYTGVVVGLLSPYDENHIGNQANVNTSIFFGIKYDKASNLTSKRKNLDVYDEILSPIINDFRSKIKNGSIYEYMDSVPTTLKHDSVEVPITEDGKTTILFTFCELKNIKLGFKL